MGDKTQKIVSTEPVRSRWTPKPEQILLLESIFNSGMVNPPKDETVRIRKLLEKFGPVGDVNVFYWFQNRRSRSRRRQKQMQAGMGMRMSAGASVDNRPYGVILGDSIHMAIQTTTSSSSSNSSGTRCGFLPSSSANSLVGDDTADDLFTISRQMGFPGVEEAPAMMIPTSSTSSTGDGLHCQSTASLITVFINGVLTEVPGGRIDMRKMFGNDMILVHSSGEIVPSTEYGVLLQGLQIGESYFLIIQAESGLPSNQNQFMIHAGLKTQFMKRDN